jgi:hypothetical protein
VWRFCAPSDDALRLVGLAQRVGFPVELTSVRLDRDGPHSVCAGSLVSAGDAGIDGYEVVVRCDGSPEVVAQVWTELAPAARGCVVLRD